MTDMHAAIIPKSDQLNSDDLIGRSITIKVREVTIRPGTEQPVSIFYDGDEGKPYKACKSMCRVMVSAWGADSSKYVGRSMTLYSDPKVKWGGMEVGGIRISHMSDIDGPLTMALTVTRANKKPYTVKPLAACTPKVDGPVITAEEVLALEARCIDNGIDVARLKKAAKVEMIAQITAARLPAVHKWLDDTIAKQAV